MKLRQTRARKIHGDAFGIVHGDRVLVARRDAGTVDPHVLKTIGFETPLADGQVVLPSPHFGPASRFNADGKEVPIPNVPLETVWRQVWWTREEWRGRDTEEVSSPIDRRYPWRPKRVIPPPAEELTVATDSRGLQCIVSRPVSYDETNQDELLHLVNLFLEIFGECELVREDFAPAVKTKLRSLNWHILPPGTYPWEKLERHVEPLVDQLPDANARSLVRWRLQHVAEHKPDFVAFGRGGFSGYLIFGFNSRKTFILESIYTGNATYVFDERWEVLARLTKAEILAGNLQTDRIIHSSKWKAKLKPHLGQ